ncbi:hypothetical protein PAXRUDRAFT_611288 [Paxillus rubicundulus Ve08.2h10]|uniref:Uncharacterized protein n=1 Tax=Paxillus rubicundulus Ve08.2h10 TaxID=930991 RepID=A0A0D0D5B4_9AGAM|nr:hypothetical protein PAXRUDRAFT_611288 [Paxillus rubicundulus Ve08.2h10]
MILMASVRCCFSIAHIEHNIWLSDGKPARVNSERVLLTLRCHQRSLWSWRASRYLLCVPHFLRYCKNPTTPLPPQESLFVTCCSAPMPTEAPRPRRNPCSRGILHLAGLLHPHESSG